LKSESSLNLDSCKGNLLFYLNELIHRIYEEFEIRKDQIMIYVEDPI